MAEFKDLPVEIRSEIWAECLSNSDMAGVYFFDPEDFGVNDDTAVELDGEGEGEGEGDQDESEWEVEREVVVAFPTIMHVCRESREYAKSHLSFREDTITNINVPCRPYRPRLDAFFVPHRYFDKFTAAFRKAELDEHNGKLPDGSKPFCREIVHLALSSRMLLDEDTDTLAYFVPEMTALRTLSFVFGNTDTLDLSRPLATADLGPEKAELVPGRPRTRVHVENTLDELMGQAKFWEISDEDTAPWDEFLGEWMFDMIPETIERVRGLV